MREPGLDYFYGDEVKMDSFQCHLVRPDMRVKE